VAALTLAGWPGEAALAAWIGLAGLLLGLAAALVSEYVVHLRQEAMRLQGIERELQLDREQRIEERRLWEYQIAVARREVAVAAVGTEVFGGAFNEAASTGHILPLAAIMARMEALQKARGLDKPLPPFRSHSDRDGDGYSILEAG
jgi:hypothetical protein